MSDLLLQLQQDIADKLNSEPLFQYNTVFTLRKAVVASEIQKRLPHLTPKNGKYGCGILVNMPSIMAAHPNVTPPIGDWVETIDVIERPPDNFDANGTQITCEQTARTVRRVLHQFNLVGLSILYQDDIALRPIEDADQRWDGCLAYQVSFKIPNVEEDPLLKCIMPAITSDAMGNATLTPGTAGDTVYYTTDGSFPGPVNLATATPPGTAVIYTVPFQVPSGTTVRAAGYAASYVGSDANQTTVTCTPPVLTAAIGPGDQGTALSWTYGGPAPAYWQIFNSMDEATWQLAGDVEPPATAWSTAVLDKYWQVQGMDDNDNPITPPSNAAHH